MLKFSSLHPDPTTTGGSGGILFCQTLEILEDRTDPIRTTP